MVTPAFRQVIILFGREEALREEAYREIRKKLSSPQSSPVETTKLSAVDLDPNEFAARISNGSLFTSRRMIYLKDLDEAPIKERRKIIDTLNGASSGTTIVIGIAAENVLSDLTSRLSSPEVKRTDIDTQAEVVRWAKGRALVSGKKMAIGAAEALLELKGFSATTAELEIEKLISYAGDREEISCRDVESVVGRSLDEAAFDLGWHISRKDASGAVSLIRDLTLAGKRGSDILGILVWHFKLALKTRTLMDKGEREPAIGRLLRVNRKHAADFFRSVRSMDVSHIQKDLRILLAVDMAIKNTKVDVAKEIEYAVVRLCLA